MCDSLEACCPRDWQRTDNAAIRALDCRRSPGGRVSHISRHRTRSDGQPCDKFLYSFKGAPRRAKPSGPGRTREVSAGSTGGCVERSGECRAAGGQGRGESRRSWRGSLARCLQRGSAPARAAARTAVTPHPLPARPPTVTHPGNRVRTSGQAVLPAPGIVPPRKDHNQGRTSSLRCGRSTLILIFHGKNRRLSGGRERTRAPWQTVALNNRIILCCVRGSHSPCSLPRCPTHRAHCR
jgi:hypothetical protein